MKKLSLPLFVLCGLALAGFAAASDWPQWRGPHQDDISKETGLLQTWPKEGPKLLWTFKGAGEGYSGPAIVGDTLYCMGADGKTEYIFAVDMNTQAKKWSTAVGPIFTEGHGNGPRGTPTVDGDLVYGIGGQGNLICVKAASGEKVWLKEFKNKSELNGDMMSGWGYCESPLVDANQVVASPGGKDGTLAAFDKKTGDVRWRTKDWTDKAAYSSIVAADICGVHQYVQVTGESVAGVSPKDGSLLWRFKRKGGVAVISTPVVSGDAVFVASAYGAGGTLVKLSKDGDVIKAEEGYSTKKMENHHGGMIVYNGYLYGANGGNGGGYLLCLDFKTGEVMWDERDKGKRAPKGSMTMADGRIYYRTEDDGTMILFEPSPKEYIERGRFQQPDRSRSKAWSHPVVANGKLYLRDEDAIFCYDVKAGTAAP